MNFSHTIAPVQRWDPFSAYFEWVCKICNHRLIRLIGFKHDWMHDDRIIEV